MAKNVKQCIVLPAYEQKEILSGVPDAKLSLEPC